MKPNRWTNGHKFKILPDHLTEISGVGIWKQRDQLKLSILLAIFSMLLGLFASELGLRFLGFRSSVLHAEMFDTVDDELLPYTLRAGYNGYYAGGKVTVTADGNRAVPLSANVFHEMNDEIILLGDSVVFGQGLDDRDTIAANMQKILEPTKIRVVMIGVPGYTSWNEYAALIRYNNLSKVRAVVLVYISNDITMDNDYFKFRKNGYKTIDVNNNIWHRLLHVAYNHSRLVFAVADVIKKVEHAMGSRHARTGIGFEVDRRALAYSMAAVKEILEECRVRGIAFVVAIYRDGGFYTNPEATGHYERELTTALEATRVNHFVLRSATNKLDHHQFGVAWNDDGHPSGEATKLVADEILGQLSKRGDVLAKVPTLSKNSITQ